MLKFCFIIFGVLIAYIGYFLRFNLDLGKPLKLHGDQKCEKVALDFPSEDLVAYGRFLIGATTDFDNIELRHFTASKAFPGSLIAIDSVSKSFYHIKLHNFPEEFQINGHGIALNNNETLYVISHSFSKGGEVIFVFQLKETTQIEAYFTTFIKLENSYGLYNGISIINSNTFYITQWQPFPDTVEGKDHSLLTSIQRTLKHGFTKSTGVKLCTIVENSAICKFQSFGYMSNGIVRKGNQLFVADAIIKTVEVFEIGKSFELTKTGQILFSHNVDNLHITNGVLYVTGTNALVDFMKHANMVKDGTGKHLTPGGVSKAWHDGVKWVTEEVIMQDKLSGPTASAIIDKQIFISSVFESAYLVCELE